MPPDSENSGFLSDKLKTEPRRNLLIPVVRLMIAAGIGFVINSAFDNLLYGVIAAVVCVICLFALFPASARQDRHFLIADDVHGFVGNLNLSDKTAVIDGNNIYHFGLHNNVGAQALKAIVQELRRDGLRVVCFFDANIYFTMVENGETKIGGRFSAEMLERVFGLKRDEIYVVPSGVQADRYVIECLTHLPRAFAVTNDRYRDHEAQHAFLATDNNWRKGVKISDGRLMLYRYKFQRPVNI